jgi:hypothetical protein
MRVGENPPIPHKRLVEECLAVSIDDLRCVFGKKALITAANYTKPIKYQLGGQEFEIYVLAEPHNLPWKNNRTWDDSLVRIWLVCLRCRKRARKLFTFQSVTGANALADLRCRWCHDLVYQSQYCSGNKWWVRVAMPLKRLLRERQRLISRRSPRAMAQLEKIDQSIWMLRERAAVRKRSYRGIPHNSRRKRAYRDINLIQ